MDGLSRNRIAAEIAQGGEKLLEYDCDAKLLLFPIRHHSPVCSYQLTRAIEEFSPTVILIEGPENANDLIPALTNDETALPAAFYYFYKDKKKLVSDEAEDYKCYYPFLYSSPEYTALSQGKTRGIDARFIDLPYCEILINTAENQGLRSDDEKHSYTDDGKLMNSEFFGELRRRTGTRSTDEFWEKYFEIEGLKLTPAEFCRSLHTYCTIIRSTADISTLEEDGTLARERHMARRIKEALDGGEKVLAVTGGFHSSGLAKLLTDGNIKPVKLHTIPPDQQGCYPTAYSYEAADALHGYSSGMSCPGFYDGVTQRLKEGHDPQKVYDDATLELLALTAKESAKKDIPVSIADVTAARSVMTGLAALRNISQCGLHELRDGVTAAFIKGEKTISSSLPIHILDRLATGGGTGHIGDKSHIPPLIADLEKQCEILGLKHSGTIQQEKDVALFAGGKGLAVSRFFHRTVFLRTEFAELVKGPDLRSGKDRSRVHELWTYHRSPRVDAALIDRTTDGFTIEEACTTAAARRLSSDRRCETAAKTAADCFLMGIPLTAQQIQLLDDIVTGDGDFFSVGEGLACFGRLYDMRKLYEMEDKSSELFMRRCMAKLISALPSMANVPDDRADQTIAIMRTMYYLSCGVLSGMKLAFEDALITMSAAKAKQPAVYGAVMGLLYAFDTSRSKDAESAMRGYLVGAPEVKKKGAEYLKGLFRTAGDILLAGDSFLQMTDELLISLSTEDFMEILPSLRLAFSYFSPYEIAETAKAAASLHGAKSYDLLYGKAIDEQLFLFGSRLDGQIRSELQR